MRSGSCWRACCVGASVCVATGTMRSTPSHGTSTRTRAPDPRQVWCRPNPRATPPAGSQVLFRLRRPAYLINSSMFVEDGEGNVVGEIQQRWHALRRNYDLYINKSQFAAISGERVGGRRVWHVPDASVLGRIWLIACGLHPFPPILDPTGTFLAWEFELKDAAGGTLALVDRNFQVGVCGSTFVYCSHAL